MIPQTFVVRLGDECRRRNAHIALDKLCATEAVQVTLEPWEPEHSDPQRRTFYWWCEYFAKTMREAGQPCHKDAVHDEVLSSIYGTEDMGFGRHRPRRTLTRPRRIGKVELDHLMREFEAWAAGQGVVLPQPNEAKAA